MTNEVFGASVPQFEDSSSVELPGTPPAGWYASPFKPGEVAWWNGSEWLESSSQAQPVALVEVPPGGPRGTGRYSAKRERLPGELMLFWGMWFGISLPTLMWLVTAFGGETPAGAVVFLALFVFLGGFLFTVGAREWWRRRRAKKAAGSGAVAFLGSLNGDGELSSGSADASSTAVVPVSGGRKVLLVGLSAALTLSGLAVLVGRPDIFGLGLNADAVVGATIFATGSVILGLAFPKTIERIGTRHSPI